MYDKTIFEAMACGCTPLVSNENLRGEIGDGFLFREGDEKELAVRLEDLLSGAEDIKQISVFKGLVEKNSLAALSEKLSAEIS